MSEDYCESLSGYDKYCILQYQELGNVLVNTMLQYGDLRENEILFVMDTMLGGTAMYYTAPFPLAAQARAVLPETEWFKTLSVAKQSSTTKSLESFRKWSDPDVLQSSKSDQAYYKFDIVSSIMHDMFEDTVETIDSQRDYKEFVIPMQYPFQTVYYEFYNSEYYKDFAIEKGGLKTAYSLEELRKLYFGPFTFDQIRDMTLQFVEDLRRIITSAPPTKSTLMLYRGMKEMSLIGASVSTQASKTFVSFSTQQFAAERYRASGADSCCFAAVTLPIGTPAFQISPSLLRYADAVDEYEVILAPGTVFKRTSKVGNSESYKVIETPLFGGSRKQRMIKRKTSRKQSMKSKSKSKSIKGRRAESSKSKNSKRSFTARRVRRSSPKNKASRSRSKSMKTRLTQAYASKHVGDIVTYKVSGQGPASYRAKILGFTDDEDYNLAGTLRSKYSRQRHKYIALKNVGDRYPFVIDAKGKSRGGSLIVQH